LEFKRPVKMMPVISSVPHRKRC